MLRDLYIGLRALLHRSKTRRDLDDEVRDFYQRAHAQHVREGLTPAQADRVLRKQFGDADLAREDLHSFGWEHAVTTLAMDVRLALRRLRNSPMFSLVAVATLALGIGAATAIASTVGPILFRSLPYPDAEQIVMLSDQDPGGAPFEVTYGTFLEIAERSRSFSALAAEDRWQPALAAERPEQIRGSFVTAEYFSVLGVEPAFGRGFLAEEDTFGGPRVVIVSDALANRLFGSAFDAVDARIRLDDAEYTIIGVMPAGFRNVILADAEVWAPRQYRTNAPFEASEWGHHMRMLGRLLPGVTPDYAREELADIAANPIAEFPRPSWATFERGLLVDPLDAAVTAGSRTMLLLVFGAVLLLLAIACANVANLLLARGVDRRNEFAVRSSLGAPRSRLIRQLLTESLVLCSLGGAIGLAVAVLAVRGIVALAPTDLPRIDEVGLDLPSFAFALAVTLIVGIGVGLLPALSGTRVSLRRDLQAGGRAIGTHGKLRRGLVAIEVALALMLLIGAGVLIRSVDRLLDVDPGFDADNLLTLRIVGVEYRGRSDEETAQYFDAVLDAVRAVPGVESAALANSLPLDGNAESFGVVFQDSSESTEGATTSAIRFAVTPEWFAAMSIPLQRGRLLGSQDVSGAPEAIVINESFARSQFGERNPIGERLLIGPEIGQPDRPWDVVVGVVADVKVDSLATEPPNVFYVAPRQWAWVDNVQSLVLRTSIEPLAALPEVRAAIWSVDSTSPITNTISMQSLLDASEAQRTFALRLFFLFAVAALALAALGIYGIMAGSVAERSREIGLRAALGATRARIVTGIVRQGLTLVLIGIVPGLIGAALLARSLASLLYETAPLDPFTVVFVTSALSVTAVAACLLPAWRAACIDPTTALRY